MILVAYMLPLAVVSPLAGVFVDKWNVKWTMIASDLTRGVLVLVLVFVRDLNAIYIIFLALSTVSSFFVPAQSVAVRALAPAAGLLAVNGLISQAVQGTQIISPAIAGLLVQWFGANACFLFDSFSFFFSAAMVMTLVIHRVPSPGAAASSVLSSMRQGFSFIFTHAAISFVILAMTAGMFAVRCFGALLSVYVRDVLLSNAALFGTLNSLIGVGMITGTQFLHRVASKVPQQFLVIYGLGGMGVAVLATALFGRIATTAIGMTGLGFGAAFIMVPSQTLLQQETPHALLGRVMSSLMSLLAMSQVLAMFVAGPVAQRLGIRNLYFGSAAMLGIVGAIGYAWLRKAKENACLETSQPF
jgi:MFS family permease